MKKMSIDSLDETPIAEQTFIDLGFNQINGTTIDGAASRSYCRNAGGIMIYSGDDTFTTAVIGDRGFPKFKTVGGVTSFIELLEREIK